MVAATITADLLSGLVLGLFVGLLVGPVIRSWLSWREWVSASREADLIGDMLDRMDLGRGPDPEEDEPEEVSRMVERRNAS